MIVREGLETMAKSRTTCGSQGAGAETMGNQYNADKLY